MRRRSRSMRIADATSRLVRSPTVTFRASEIGEDLFGLNMPNDVLFAALEGALSAKGDRLAAIRGRRNGRSATHR